jgi:TetR/AcrR family transcriptional repressor of nem operon
MKKSKLETAETRKRILVAASTEFRLRGFDGASLADLMAAAGLTLGGFYKHFSSKEQLISEAFAVAAESELHAVERSLPASANSRGIDALVEAYLSLEHRDDVAGGCPFVALGSEVARGGGDVREAATAGFRKMVSLTAGQLGGSASEAAEGEAMAVLSMMVGALAMARMVADSALSARILREARRYLADRRHPAPPPPDRDQTARRIVRPRRRMDAESTAP